MRTRVQRWGNGLAVRIPQAFATEIGLTDGSSVEVSLESGKLVVTPLVAPRCSLERLLAGVTVQNMHREVDAGQAVGDEAW